MRILAFDTETKGFDWWDGQTAFLISWATDEGEWVTTLDDEKGMAEFRGALDAAHTVVAHNLSFDTHQLRESIGIDLLDGDWELHDTDILARVCNPYGNRKEGRGGFKLKELAPVFVDPDAAGAEDDMKELAEAAKIKLNETGGYYNFWRAYPDVMEKYAAQDARITYDLFLKLLPMLNDDTKRCYELERQVMPVLIRAEQRGIPVDGNAANELYEEYKAIEKELHERLSKSLGDNALGGEGSEAALLEALQSLGVPLYRTTQTGKLSTSKFALQEFEDDYPEIADFMEWRRVSRFISTYLGPMRNREVVHTSFRQCEAWTGRMSSARPNLQNLPKRAGREVRRPIRSGADDRVLVACDFDGIEARLLAYYMADEDYRQFFREGSDPHAWMAAQIHGGEPEMFAKGTDGENDRNEAKNTLFAITYGAGANRVSDMNKITKGQAKALISKIKSALPKYRRLMGRVQKKIKYSGYVTTYHGREQYVNKDKSYVGLNALIQGSAADLMKIAVVKTDRALSARPELDAHLVLFVHDEIVADCPEEHAQEVAEIIRDAMLSAGSELDPPLDASYSIGRNYEEV